MRVFIEFMYIFLKLLGFFFNGVYKILIFSIYIDYMYY